VTVRQQDKTKRQDRQESTAHTGSTRKDKGRSCQRRQKKEEQEERRNKRRSEKREKHRILRRPENGVQMVCVCVCVCARACV
jgi:hypothetical protein